MEIKHGGRYIALWPEQTDQSECIYIIGCKRPADMYRMTYNDKMASCINYIRIWRLDLLIIIPVVLFMRIMYLLLCIFNVCDIILISVFHK